MIKIKSKNIKLKLIKQSLVSIKTVFNFFVDTGEILYIMGIYNISLVVEMKIIISNSGGQPIYEQIVTQIKSLIISGELNEGDALPSMRLLAKELRISVITTKRAYEELEREGFIVSVTGKGSFVASKNIELIREQRLKEIEGHMQSAVDLAGSCGVGIDELIEMITLIHEGE